MSLINAQNSSKAQSTEKELKKPTTEGTLIRDAYKELRALYSNPQDKIVMSSTTAACSWFSSLDGAVQPSR